MPIMDIKNKESAKRRKPPWMNLVSMAMDDKYNLYKTKYHNKKRYEIWWQSHTFKTSQMGMTYEIWWHTMWSCFKSSLSLVVSIDLEISFCLLVNKWMVYSKWCDFKFFNLVRIFIFIFCCYHDILNIVVVLC
jgi:hypothetical protein